MTSKETYAIRQRGMSLIELMIAMTLGLLIVAGITMLFVQNKQSYNQDQMLARMQEDARHALNTMVDDIELTGFWADVHAPENVDRHADLTIGTSCDGTTPWLYEAARPVIPYDHTSASAINTIFGCVTNPNYQNNTDAIAINRVIGTAISQTDIDAGTASLAASVIYMRSNGANGLLLDSTMDGSIITGTINYWQYIPRLYYVRNYANTAGDGIPTLCMFELDYATGTPSMRESCIAQGVESLQIEYGIDTDVDGIANRYRSDPPANLVQGRLVSVRLHLLMRSREPDPAYTNEKTYTLGNLVNYAPGDNFYRRVYTTTVLIRNTRNLRCLTTGCPKNVII